MQFPLASFLWSFGRHIDVFDEDVFVVRLRFAVLRGTIILAALNDCHFFCHYHCYYLFGASSAAPTAPTAPDGASCACSAPGRPLRSAASAAYAAQRQQQQQLQ